ncbi:MAG: hypothetical protein JST02_11040, partial [Bacteroidetes bacterium]|nr:hypothetical protein [Bacteroidota bacterium]
NTYLYLDGNLAATKGSPIPSPGVNGPWPHNLMIGSQWFPGEIFDGYVDELQVWNVARTQSQIQAGMHVGQPSNTSGLVAYFTFNEGAGSSTTDVTANGYNAALVNNPQWLTSTALPNAPTVQWNLNGNPISGATGSTYVANLPGNYTVSATSGQGCIVTSNVATVSVNTLDFVNLQWPPNASVCSGTDFTTYGQVLKTGITGTYGVAVPGIAVQYGYSTSDTDPATWTNWLPATFNALANWQPKDEYMATFGSTLAPGTYYYTFRYSLNGCAYQYGGFNVGGGGTWDGVNNVSGVLTVNPMPEVDFAGLPTTICSNAEAVTLTGTPAGGVFSGTGISGNTFDPSVAGVGGPYTITYTYSTLAGCTASSNATVTVTNCVSFATLNLHVFLEGFYMSEGTLQSNLSTVEISTDPLECDTITVNLWDPLQLSNTDPAYSEKSVLHIDGTATVNFPQAVIGNNYYVAVKHRNHVETWSHDPVLFSAITGYNFTQALSAAYDDGVNPPMKSLGDGNFGMYAGDINQDGTVDGQDMNVIDNNNGFFGYDNSDINGDGGTDGQDMNFVDNNSQLSLFYARPY